jgi:hypothetical protein
LLSLNPASFVFETPFQNPIFTINLTLTFHWYKTYFLAQVEKANSDIMAESQKSEGVHGYELSSLLFLSFVIPVLFAI